MQFAISIATPEVPGEAPLALFCGTFEERLQKAADNGYQGVELVVSDPTQLDPREISRLLRQKGLRCAAVASGFIAGSRGVNLVSPQEEVRQKAVSILRDMILFASQMGAKVVTIGGFRGKACSVGSLETARQQLHQALSQVDDLADSLGVSIALEPIQSPESDFLNTAADVCGIIREGNYRAVKLLLDIYHMIPSEEAQWDTFVLYREHLVHVHLADTNRRALGAGDLDFAPIEDALLKIGYAGWQSVELPRGDAPDQNGCLPDSLRSWS